MLNARQPGPTYYLFVNMVVVIALSGAVILIANNLTQIPALVFIGGFSVLAAGLGYTGYLRHKEKRMVEARIWYFWSGIAYGLAVFSGAHLLGLTNFIPDLLLLWLVGLTLLAVWGSHTFQLGLAVALNGVWLYLVFLYDQSYLPGLVMLAVTGWFLFRRRPSGWLFNLALLTLIFLCNLYFYELLHPAHYPLNFSVSHLVFTIGLLGCLTGLAALTFAAAQWPAYARLLRRFTTVVGVAILIVLSIPAVSTGLAVAFDGSLTGVIVGGALLLAAAIPLFTRPVATAHRLIFVIWSLAFVLFVAGLFAGAAGMLPFLPLVAALFTSGVAGYWLVMGVRRLSLWQIFAGLALLGLICLIILMAWSPSYLINAFILFILAAVVWISGERYHQGLHRLHETDTDTAPAESNYAVSGGN